MTNKKLKLYNINIIDKLSSNVVLSQKQVSRNMDELKKAYSKLFHKSEYNVVVKFIKYVKI